MNKTLYFFALLALLTLSTFSCNCTKTTKDAEMPDYIIENELIVSLKEGVSPRRFVSTFEDYKLEQVKAISSAMNMYLFSYDTSLIAPKKMLKKVTNSPDVKMAEFNKKLNIRNQ